MPFTNFPQGVSSFGVPLPSDGLAPLTGGRTFWVCNRSGLKSGDGSSPEYPFSTLNAALAKCQAARGDTILIGPGHVETISSADQMSNLVSNVTIVGCGLGNQRPILRWTAATATFLFDQAGTVLKNCRLQMAGDPDATTALTVAAPITVSAAGCAILGCDFNIGVDADQIITVGIAVTAAGFEFARNRVFGAAAAEITAAGTFIRLNAADRAYIHHNKITGALATDTDGLIETLTTASADIEISDNLFHSNGASSDTCIDMGANIVVTGWLVRNFCRNMTDANNNQIVVTGTGVDVQLMDNFGINNSNERGLVIGTASV